MSGERGQGQSRNGTQMKEGTFAFLLAWHLSYCARRNRGRSRRPFFYVDLNAGMGFNQEAGVSGSPVLFIRHAKRWADSLRCVGYLVEKNHHRHLSLTRTLGALTHPVNGSLFPALDAQAPVWFAEKASNAEFLKDLPVRIQGHQVAPACAEGMIYSDANGVNRDRGGFPLVEIGRAAKVLQSMVVTIHYAWQSATRVQGYNETHGPVMDVFTAADIIRMIPRRHWLIGKSTRHGRVLLCGSHYLIPEHRKHPPYLYQLHSAEGQEIWQQIKGRFA